MNGEWFNDRTTYSVTTEEPPPTLGSQPKISIWRWIKLWHESKLLISFACGPDTAQLLSKGLCTFEVKMDAFRVMRPYKHCWAMVGHLSPLHASVQSALRHSGPPAVHVSYPTRQVISKRATQTDCQSAIYTGRSDYGSQSVQCSKLFTAITFLSQSHRPGHEGKVPGL